MKYLIFLVSVSLYAQIYPKAILTPGVLDKSVTQQNLHSTICDSGYTAEVRKNLKESMKKEVVERYGLTWPLPHGAYEIDHFIPLELGGANDINNLRPQPAKPVPGFHQKDVVENYLHRQVCDGDMSLAEAQAQIRQWLVVYQKIKK